MRKPTFRQRKLMCDLANINFIISAILMSNQIEHLSVDAQQQMERIAKAVERVNIMRSARSRCGRRALDRLDTSRADVDAADV
jgi:hypothetical protein